MSFKVPPDPALLPSRLPIKRRGGREKVLDEDEYVEQVERIIERDFFPELSRLKAQSEFMDAARRRDTDSMNSIRERFTSLQRQRATAESPATFDTPVTSGLARGGRDDDGAASTASDLHAEGSNSGAAAGSSEAKSPESSHLSLDRFMQTHTSEDNASFEELMENEAAEFRRTHAWMFKADEQLSIENKAKQLTLPALQHQADQSDAGIKAVDGWTYKNVNNVFYHPDGVELTAEEKMELSKKSKRVILENTRFQSYPWKSDISESDMKQSLFAKKEANLGKVGVDGKELVDPRATPEINGYSLLRISDPTPMFDAGAESPLMTWGEVDSTPFRLKGSDTPLPMYASDATPSFKIQDVPKRDRLAHELAERNSKLYRDKKSRAIQQVKSSIKTPRTGTLSDRVATMSPAAQKLATSRLGIRLGTDKSLRSCYTPSPASSSYRKGATPSALGQALLSASPSLVRAHTKGQYDHTPVMASESASLTDDLLNLPSTSKRPRASDFME